PENPTPAFVAKIKQTIGTSSISVHGPGTVRVVVRDQGRRTIVHLLNLNIQKLSSFEDKVTPAENVEVEVRVPLRRAHSVKHLSADEDGTDRIKFTTRTDGGQLFVRTTVPNLKIAALLVVE